MPMHRWMASAAGGTSQRLKPGPAMVRSLASQETSASFGTYAGERACWDTGAPYLSAGRTAVVVSGGDKSTIVMRARTGHQRVAELSLIRPQAPNFIAYEQLPWTRCVLQPRAADTAFNRR